MKISLGRVVDKGSVSALLGSAGVLVANTFDVKYLLDSEDIINLHNRVVNSDTAYSVIGYLMTGATIVYNPSHTIVQGFSDGTTSDSSLTTFLTGGKVFMRCVVNVYDKTILGSWNISAVSTRHPIGGGAFAPHPLYSNMFGFVGYAHRDLARRLENYDGKVPVAGVIQFAGSNQASPAAIEYFLLMNPKAISCTTSPVGGSNAIVFSIDMVSTGLGIIGTGAAKVGHDNIVPGDNINHVIEGFSDIGVSCHEGDWPERSKSASVEMGLTYKVSEGAKQRVFDVGDKMDKVLNVMALYGSVGLPNIHGFGMLLPFSTFRFVTPY